MDLHCIHDHDFAIPAFRHPNVATGKGEILIMELTSYITRFFQSNPSSEILLTDFHLCLVLVTVEGTKAKGIRLSSASLRYLRLRVVLVLLKTVEEERGLHRPSGLRLQGCRWE
jgi:hypothetical protein